MEILVYVLLIALGATGIYFFIQFYRHQATKPRDPRLPIPGIPTEFPPKPDPPKVFLDPLIMQMHGEHTETLLFVSVSGVETEVLVNSSVAKIFRYCGWSPFRLPVKSWANSPAYCRCGPRFGDTGDELGEMSLAYLYGRLIGEAEFDQAFEELVEFWLQNAERFGYDRPKRKSGLDFTQSGC